MRIHASRFYIGMTMYVAVLLFLPFSAMAEEAGQVLHLEGSQQEYDLHPYIQVMEDRTGSLTIEEVLQLPKEGFVVPDRNPPNFGFTQSRIWTKLEIQNAEPVSQHRYLELANPRMQFVDMYVVQDGRLISHKKGGSGLPFSAREYDYRYPAFALELPAHSRLSVLVSTSSQTSHFITLTLRSEMNLTSVIARDYLFNGLLFGVLTFLLIFNFVLVKITEDSVFIAQTGYLLCALIYTISMQGFGYQFLWSGSVWWAHNSGNILAALTVLLACRFGQRFLSTKLRSSSAHTILNAVIYTAALLTLGAFVLDYPVTQKYLVVLGLVYPVLLLGISVIEWRAGHAAARFFVVAFSVLCISLFIWVLRLAGVIPEIFIFSNAVLIGLVSEFTLLTVAMLDRLNSLKHSQLSAVQKRLHTSRKLLDVTHVNESFVPLKALELLEIKNLGEARLGDQVEARMSILFINIHDLTSRVAEFESEQKIEFLNQYFKLINPIVTKYNGFVCRYIGDSMQCVFPHDADDAVTAANEMLNELHLIGLAYSIVLGESPAIDMGVHTGHMRLGIVGEPNRMELQVLGDGVNLAARVQSVAHEYGATLLISGETRRAMTSPEKVCMRLIDVMRPRGRIESVAMYEVFDNDSAILREQKLTRISEFEKAVLAKHDNQTETAIKLLNEFISICPDDLVARTYLSRLQGVQAIESPSGLMEPAG